MLNPLVSILFLSKNLCLQNLKKKFEEICAFQNYARRKRKKKERRRIVRFILRDSLREGFSLSTRLPLKILRRVGGRRYRENKIGGFTPSILFDGQNWKGFEGGFWSLYNGRLPLCAFMRCKRPYVYLNTPFFDATFSHPKMRFHCIGLFTPIIFRLSSEPAFRNSMAFRRRVILCSRYRPTLKSSDSVTAVYNTGKGKLY